MTAEDALALYDRFERAGAPIWIDGGWAVDANLGRQTREHADLDIVIEQVYLATAVSMLQSLGYEDVPRDDTRPWNFVMGDGVGREVDFHVIVLDESGDGIYGPPESEDRWPAESLGNRGTISGRTVRATSPRWLIASHTGYRLTEKDWSDVLALSERFGLAVPDDYAEFRGATQSPG